MRVKWVFRMGVESSIEWSVTKTHTRILLIILLTFYSRSTDDSPFILLEILIPAADDSTPILHAFY